MKRARVVTWGSVDLACQYREERWGPRPAPGEGCHKESGLPVRRPGQGLPTSPPTFSQTWDLGSWHSPNGGERATENDKYRTSCPLPQVRALSQIWFNLERKCYISGNTSIVEKSITTTIRTQYDWTCIVSVRHIIHINSLSDQNSQLLVPITDWGTWGADTELEMCL